MNHNLSAFVSAGLSLIGVPGCLAGAAKSDFAWLLRVQAGLSSLPPTELAKKEAECRAATEARRAYLRQKSVASLAWVLTAALAATWLVYPHLVPSGVTKQQAFAIASVLSFSWGTLGRLGWTERSIKGSTIYEELDTFMFWLLYWLGALCGVAAVVNA